MNVTVNKLSPDTKAFFRNLEEYLDTPLIYYGSVQRPDYLPERSDIDIAIFTDNETSILVKMQHFLHVDREQFKRIVWNIDGIVVHGYKLKYEQQNNNNKKINAEFSIYNTRFKELVVNEQVSKFKLPFLVSLLLILLKSVHYYIPLLSPSQYATGKRFLLTACIGKPEDQFLVLK